MWNYDAWTMTSVQVLRDMFCFKPSMTKEQFFTLNSFAERKIIMCTEIMRLVRERYRFTGPKNPTNPNIKVSPVVDTGLHPKVRLGGNMSHIPKIPTNPNIKVSSVVDTGLHPKVCLGGIMSHIT